MIQPRDIGIVWVGYGVEWAADVLQNCFDRSVRMYSDLGIEPDRLAAQAPGLSSNYGEYKNKRRYLKPESFLEMRSFELIRLDENKTNELVQWTLRIGVSKRGSTVILCWDSVKLGPFAEILLGGIKDLATITGMRYGYTFRQSKSAGPLMYASGILYRASAEYVPGRLDSDGNIGEWDISKISSSGGSILRDVYTENYLGRAHLSAPYGQTARTLQEWIEESPDSRGTLERYTDTTLVWKPPIKNIPIIREELYRAGRVFYWKFMKPKYFDAAGTGKLFDEPLYRPDLAAPWEAEGPTPEIFTADYYKDKDPGLTY